MGVVGVSRDNSAKRDTFAVQCLAYPDGNPANRDPFADGMPYDNRVFPHWADHEPARGIFDWGSSFWNLGHGFRSNTVLACAYWLSKGRNSIVCLGDGGYTTPGWTTNADDPAYYEYVQQMCIQAKPYALEPFNEPVGIPPAFVAARTALCRAAAHSVNPSIIIVGPSFESWVAGGTGLANTLACLAAGLGSSIDALSVHLYPHGLTRVASDGSVIKEPCSLFTQIPYMQAGLAGHWSGAIWNTECGQFVANEHQLDLYTEAEQVRWSTQMLHIPRLFGIAKSLGFAYNQSFMGFQNSAYRQHIIDRITLLRTLDKKPLRGFIYTPGDIAYTAQYSDGTNYLL